MTTRAGLMWCSPNERTPGVSITQPPASEGSGSASAEVVVWRPRPVTTLTSPVRRAYSGTRALTSVVLPTPLWPTHAVIRPDSRSRTSSSAAPSSASCRVTT